jgi:preprotein translocase subunit SecA
MILGMVENEIEQVISFHTASEYIKDWNLKEIHEVVSTIFPVDRKLEKELVDFAEEEGKLNKAKARTVIIEHLFKLAEENYEKIKEQFKGIGINFKEVEKAILIRSIDTLWIEHLDAMDYMRRGIGLRGYGQHDPLVEYKKEAYHLFNELNNLIQKEVVYSIFKIGDVKQVKAPSLADRAKNFSAPSKVMDENSASFSGFKQMEKGSHSATIDMVKPKQKDASGEKIGRNDPCPCGSGKKYKKCCGK